VPHRFSLPALVSQTARQTGSGGSTLIGISFCNETIENNEPFVPPSMSGTFKTANNDQLSRISTTSLIPSIGYGYQYNFTENFSVTGSIAYGIGLAQVRRNGGKDQNEINSATKTDIEIAIAYNALKYYTGMRSTLDDLTINGQGADNETALSRNI